MENLFKMWKTFQGKTSILNQKALSNNNCTLFRTAQKQDNLAVFLTTRAPTSRSSLHFLSHRSCKNSCIHFTGLKELVFTDDVSRETIFHQRGVFVENYFRKDVAYFALKNKNRGKNPGCLMCFCKNRFPSTFSIL